MLMEEEGGALLWKFSCLCSALQTMMAEPKKGQVNFVAIKLQYIYKEEEAAKVPSTKEAVEDGEVPDKKQKLEEAGGGDCGDAEEVKKAEATKQEVKPQRYRERAPIFDNLCKTLIDVPVNAPMPVCESLRCKFLHDVSKFLQSKPPDIAEECHVFNLKGHCPRGISCRFGSKHISETGRNIVNEVTRDHYEKHLPKTLTYFTKEIECDLRKRTYDFKKSEDVLENLPKSKPPPPHAPPFGHFTPYSIWGQGEIDFTEDIDVPSQPDSIPPLIEEPIGPCPDDDLFQLHLTEKKKIDWTNKLYLQPLSNFGNLPFRRICKEYGADVTCSETVVAASILQGQPFEWLLTKRHETENIFGVQLFGNNPYALTRCAQLIEEHTNVDFIDLNFGSPGEMMMYRTRGVQQLRREKVLETIVRCMSRVASLPLTVSTKLGDYTDEKLISKFLPNYKACHVSLVTIHGRSRDTKQADWEYIRDTAKRLEPVPVFGTSDVLTCCDYFQLKEQYPETAGALIGRGALVKPWLFGEIKQQKDWDITSGERFEILRRFVNYGLEHWGSDAKGVELTRRFLLDWMSFLCRYIPVGLLERPPQKMNDKCVRYIGRDDMETLLGSQDPADWVKISEMLLGSYPDHYHFVCKVRANCWPVDS